MRGRSPRIPATCPMRKSGKAQSRFSRRRESRKFYPELEKDGGAIAENKLTRETMHKIEPLPAFQGEHFLNRYGKEATEQSPPIAKMLEMGVPVGAGTDATRV